jgi:type I restriction enzyme S subunit
MLELADGLLARIEGASRRIERSSQAVLAKAFRGELIQTTAG